MITEYLLSFFSLFFSAENQLVTMFVSGFLSSTLLPGNSEVIFSTLVGQQILLDKTLWSPSLVMLILVATFSNALGSFVTYLMGKLVPKPIDPKNRYATWALAKSEKYGAIILLLSWLPLVGDLLCGIAGWLKFPVKQTLFYLIVGKFLRYLLLLFSVYPFVKYVVE